MLRAVPDGTPDKPWMGTWGSYGVHVTISLYLSLSLSLSIDPIEQSIADTDAFIYDVCLSLPLSLSLSLSPQSSPPQSSPPCPKT